MVKKTLLYLLFFLVLSSEIFYFFNYSWDFITYKLNGFYFFGKSSYFEIYRPPLLPLLLGIFDTPKIAYLLICFSAFFAAVKSFAKKHRIKEHLFLLGFFSPIALYYASFAGTEILYLSFFMLALSFTNFLSPLFFGLATLTHYSMLAFFPSYLLFLCLQKISAKRFFAYLGIVFAVWVPWLAYNYYKTGYFFASLLENYFLNIANRMPSLQRNFLLFIFPYLIVLPEAVKKIKKADLLFVFILINAMVYFATIPYKIPRYLYAASLPLAFLFAKIDKSEQKSFFALAFLIFALAINFYLFYNSLGYQQKIYQEFLASLNFINKSCAVASDYWIYYNELGIKAIPLPRKNMVRSALLQGYQFVFFKTIDRSYLETIEPFKTYENSFIIFKANSCKKIKEVFVSYLAWAGQQSKLTNNPIKILRYLIH